MNTQITGLEHCKVENWRIFRHGCDHCIDFECLLACFLHSTAGHKEAASTRREEARGGDNNRRANGSYRIPRPRDLFGELILFLVLNHRHDAYLRARGLPEQHGRRQVGQSQVSQVNWNQIKILLQRRHRNESRKPVNKLNNLAKTLQVVLGNIEVCYLHFSLF